MSSYVPKITRYRQALEQHLSDESAAGRITPAIVDFPPYIDADKHDRWPACVIRTGDERPVEGHRQMVVAQVSLHVALMEDRDQHGPTEIENLVWQTMAALDRTDGCFGIGKGMEWVGTRYIDRARSDTEVIRAAVIELRVAYHVSYGEIA